jgi:hypothetical protein
MLSIADQTHNNMELHVRAERERERERKYLGRTRRLWGSGEAEGETRRWRRGGREWL